MLVTRSPLDNESAGACAERLLRTISLCRALGPQRTRCAALTDLVLVAGRRHLHAVLEDYATHHNQHCRTRPWAAATGRWRDHCSRERWHDRDSTTSASPRRADQRVHIGGMKIINLPGTQQVRAVTQVWSPTRCVAVVTDIWRAASGQKGRFVNRLLCLSPARFVRLAVVADVRLLTGARSCGSTTLR